MKSCAEIIICNMQNISYIVRKKIFLVWNFHF